MIRKLGVVGLFLAAVAALSFSTPAEANKWVTEAWPWAGSTSDTLFITDEADTQRTASFSTANLDWPAGNASAATAPLVIARVTFVAQVSNAVSDTIRYTVEYSNTPAGKPEVWSFLVGGALGATDATGNIALLQSGVSTTANVVYEGIIFADPDAVIGPLNIMGAARIRLRVIGDQSGSTPKLSGVRVSISYPKRIISG